MATFATDDIIPPAPDGLDVLHDREYRVRAFRIADDRILLQGAVRDQKPPGLYVPGDPGPLTVHHMQLSLEVSFPDLVIVGATLHFESHPHGTCPSIVDHYGELEGLSIARGFTHTVRELFGGPRGCTHVTALLQAMAPVAVQCFWSMRSASARARGETTPMGGDGDDEGWRRIVGSCHVWDAEGPLVAERAAGVPMEMPVFLRKRLAELGRDAR